MNRTADEYEVIGYGTGSQQHTKLSYDLSGSYFDLDMSLLEKDYAYTISLITNVEGKYTEIEDRFKFRVD